MKRPKLTLCVIARDEEATLGDCLASVRGVVDAMVVVDTGSRDRTVEIATNAGAEVLHHTWNDDFAAARNAALAAVKDGFILLLDADERLAPGAGEGLRTALARDDFDLGFLRLHHADGLDAAAEAVLSGARRLGDPAMLPRLLRRTPDLRWQGVVHEDVSAWAATRVMKMLDSEIVHYGACPEARQARGKDARNLALLRRRAADEPDNAWVRAYLARELARSGLADAALAEARAGWQALGRVRDAGDVTGDVVLIGTVLAHLLLDAGELAEMTAVVDCAAHWSDEHPNFYFLAGVAAEQHAMHADDANAMLREAARCYQACLDDTRDLPGESISGSRGWQGWTRLGTVALRRQQADKALRAFDKALAGNEDLVEARLGRAEALLHQGGAQTALAELMPLVGENCLDAWLLAAVAASQLEAHSDAALFASRALELVGSSTLVAPHRASLLKSLLQDDAEPGAGEQAASTTPRALQAKRPTASAEARSVLVLGSGRSGTSMLAGTLAEAGWFVGKHPYPARDSNPKGFFETFEVNGVNEALLGEVLPAHCDLGDWQRWLAEVPTAARWKIRPELEARMRALLEQRPFAFKDPRFCATLPAWRPFLGDTKFVCVFRSPAVTAESIVQECAAQETLRGLGIDFERALRVWHSMYREILECHSREGEWLFLHYDQLFEGDGLDRLEAFVGAGVARDFPERALSRTRSERAVPPEVADLYRDLCERAGANPGPIATRVPFAAAARKPDATAKPKLSVILCSENGRPSLERSLAAWEAQSASHGRFELLVVHDGKDECSAAWLTQRDFRVPAQVMSGDDDNDAGARSENLTFARNRAIDLARGELLLFASDEVIPSPELVDQHIAAHAEQAGEALAVLGGFERTPEARAKAFHRCMDDRALDFGDASLTAGQRYDWTRFRGYNLSVSAMAVRDVGGFDAAIQHADTATLDLGLRLCARGVAVLYAPKLRATHDVTHEQVLDLDAFEARSRREAQGWLRLLHKHPEVFAHPEWRWLAPLDLEACDQFVIDRLPRLAAWRSAARELAELDIARIERGCGSAASHPVLRALEDALRGLQSVAWREGIAAGLRELGVSSCAELASKRADSCTLLAWPQYSEAAVDQLFAEWAPHLVGKPGLRLCLVHDAAQDGEESAAVRALEKAYARHVRDDAALDIELVAPPKDADALGVLRDSIDAALDLPGSQQAVRRDFFEKLGAPRWSDPSAARLPRA